ncbi:MAG: dephospho-CoA kinase, partial [Desulfovibrio sp.]|nr:dephospho-CoA kinase [Desulfovibrio sp.]
MHIDAQGTGRRLDSVLAALLPQYSRAALKKAILSGMCCLDGLPATKPDVRVRLGQHLELTIAEPRSTLEAEEGDLDIVWQDAHLVLCNKSAGLTVHPCPSCPEQTLVQRLLGRFPQLSKLEGQRPGIVHRLDKDTSGLLLVALTESMRLRLSEAFARREVHKRYLALVSGLAPEKGECREPLGRHPATRVKMCVLDISRGGKPAHTEWRRLWYNPAANVSLLEVRIHTGRTHQIRVHMAHVGHPLLGDRLYAPAPVRDMAPRQMLHAWQLDLVHPHTGEPLHFSCLPPDDIPAAALAACHAMQRVVLTGNPGCGKSSLAAQLRDLGLPVLNADAVVQELYAPGGEAAQWIAQRWGEQLLTAKGQVDKAALLQAMQSSPYLKKELETLVHALVRAAVERFLQKQ